MPFEQFDRSQLRILPLSERDHDLCLDDIVNTPTGARSQFEHPALAIFAERIVNAARNRRAVIFACGAHVLRQGNAPLLIDLMQRGLLTHIALNGAGAIHDFELALIGQTCESVSRYVGNGQFGLWQETARINEAAVAGSRDGIGLGEAIGRMIEDERLPHRQSSLLAAG